MKSFTKEEFTVLEEKVFSIGVELSLITSLVKFLELGLSDDLGLTDMDLANLAVVLKRHILEIGHKYDKIECMLEV